MLTALTPITQAASQSIWTSSTSGNWSNGANWGGTAPSIDPNGDASLEFNATGTYTANNNLGAFGVYNTTFDTGNGTTTLTGADINLSWPLSEANNPTFTNNSTQPVTINNNVNFAAPPGVGGTFEYFNLAPGSTTTMNGSIGLTGGSGLLMTNGQNSGTGGPGGTMIWTQPVVFTNNPTTGYSGYFPFRIYEGTFEMGGYTIYNGGSDAPVLNIQGVNIIQVNAGVNNGAVTDMYIGPEDYESGHPNDVASIYLISAGQSFNQPIQIGDAGTITIGGLNTTGTVYFNDFFKTLPTDGNGIVNGVSQTIYYSAAAGGTVVQNFQLVRGGGSGHCSAGIDKIGAGIWVVNCGGDSGTDTGTEAYTGNTTVRDGTLELEYDDTGTGYVTLPAAALSNPNATYYASGNDGGSLGANAATNPVQLGDTGTLATDNIALLTLTGAGGPRLVVHNINVNNYNPNGTTSIGVSDNGTANFQGNIQLNKTAVLTGGTGGIANFSGTITGTGGVTVNGTGTVNLSATDAYNGPTSVNQGTLTIATTGSIPNSAITVGNGTTSGKLTFAANASGTLAYTVASLNVSGTGLVSVQSGAGRSVLIVNGSFSNSGKIDLFNNDMVVKAGGASGLTAIQAQLKSGFNPTGAPWQGSTGITSSTAASDARHIMALGVSQNSNGSAILFGTGGLVAGSFDGQTTLGSGDVLVKYTYFGDATLDGKVDSSDYTRIDNGFLHHLAGWYNGDFNYDAVVNGSDYTLIDNAFNTQGNQISSSALIAAETSQIAPAIAAVPEPSTLGLLGICGFRLLSQSRRRRLK